MLFSICLTEVLIIKNIQLGLRLSLSLRRGVDSDQFFLFFDFLRVALHLYWWFCYFGCLLDFLEFFVSLELFWADWVVKLHRVHSWYFFVLLLLRLLRRLIPGNNAWENSSVGVWVWFHLHQPVVCKDSTHNVAIILNEKGVPFLQIVFPLSNVLCPVGVVKHSVPVALTVQPLPFVTIS